MECWSESSSEAARWSDLPAAAGYRFVVLVLDTPAGALDFTPDLVVA